MDFLSPLSNHLSNHLRNQGNKNRLHIVASIPRAVAQGQITYRKVVQFRRTSVGAALEVGGFILGSILDTRSSDIEKIWEKIEKGLYNGKELLPKSKNPWDQFATTLGMIHSVVEHMHQESSISSLQGFRELTMLYGKAKSHIHHRLIDDGEERDQQIMTRVLNTLDKQFTAASKSFNEKIQNQELPGPPLLSSL